MNLVYFFPSSVTLTPGWRRTGLAATCPLTKEMFWRSWCCHENGDTLDWHTESLRPCWCKWCRGYSCAAGSSTRPHLEDKTVECDWQAGRATCQTTSLFPGYHRHNHGMLRSKCLLFEILFSPQFSLPRTRCHAYFSSVGEEVRSVVSLDQIWTAVPSAGMKAPRWTLKLVTNRCTLKSWQGLLQDSVTLLSGCVHSHLVLVGWCAQPVRAGVWAGSRRRGAARPQRV